MAYKSLYRAYRPQVFDDVSGQEAIITTLKHAVSEDRIAHAYLFCGPRGTGKTTVAKLFAKAVNCTGTHKPCGECDNCKAIENGSHPDVIEIDAASNNGVEEVRNLIDKVKYAPVNGKYKVYIIDEVHMMSTGAFNALLKTLEEPPAHVIFILATTEPHKILPTIISRCQRFDFTSLTNTQMINRMKTVLEEEGKTYEEGALQLIAKLANGGMRDALSILEQCLAYNDQFLKEEDVNKIYGIISIEDKINLIKTILNGQMEEALNLLNKMDNNGTDIRRLTYDLIDILKDVVIYKNTKNLSILSVLSNQYINLIVPYITSEECLNFIDILVDATEKYVKATSPHIYFELAVLKMCNQDQSNKKEVSEPVKVEPIKPIKKIEEILETPEETIDLADDDQVEEVEEINETIEPPTFDFEEDQDVLDHVDEDIDVDRNDLLNILVQAKRTYLDEAKEKWQILPSYMTNLKLAKAAGMLISGEPVAACKEALIIAFEYMPDVNAVNYYKNYRQLTHFLKELLNKDVKIVAMQKDDWFNLRNEFIRYKKAGQLPQPHNITLKHIDGYDLDNIDRTEAEKYALKIFGNDIVEFTEE